MNLDPSLVNSVRVLCALEGNAYWPTGRVCARCGGNDDIHEPITRNNAAPSFCAEWAVSLCSSEKDRSLVREFATVLTYLGIDFDGVPVTSV